MPRKILVLADGISHAHVVRPKRLAEELAALGHEVTLGLPDGGGSLFTHMPVPTVPVWSLDPDTFLGALRRLERAVDEAVLGRYLASDLSAIEAARPDLVVHDLRLSAPVAARLSGIPSVALTGAYWSPYSPRRMGLPVNVQSSLLGYTLSQALRPFTERPLMRWGCEFVDRFRERHGLPRTDGDPFALVAGGEHVWYVDYEDFVPVSGAPPGHVFIGPLLWSAEGAPGVPDDARTGRPLVYVPIGSSGDPELGRLVVGALRGLPVHVLVAAGGNAPAFADLAGEGVTVMRAVDGNDACRAASLVVSNGGSPQLWQALEQGTPVLGLPTNMDQVTVSLYAPRTGAAATLHPLRATRGRIAREARRLLNDPAIRERAAAQAGRLERCGQRERIAQALATVP